ncbi:MAG: hypothetical protein FWG43_01695 [Clostridiales bacterium]|nr:hypothetical protein [Clostridiales bacterium]
MKKFVFTLEALAKYKASLEKKQKAELFRVTALLNTLYGEQNRLKEDLKHNDASQNQALQEQQELIAELKRHNNYRLYLQEKLAELKKQILAAQAEKKRIQALLIVIMKEIKTLKRLRSEQYQAYLEEVRKEEALIISDIIAHKNMS